MALVNCPECGREKVSDSAISCPSCGFGIKTHFERIRANESEERIRQNRYKSVQMPPIPQRKFEGTDKAILWTGIVLGVFFSLFLWGNIIFSDAYDSGSNEIMSIIGIATAISLIVAAFIEREKKYKMKVEDYTLAKKSFNEYQKTIINRQDYEQKMKDAAEAMMIKCPVCGSISVDNITTLNRFLSIGAFGLASGKIGKQYQCKACKHMW